MNRRSETRFQVFSRAQLILLNHPERELNVALTDVSGAGFRLLADEAPPVGSMIAVETDAHLILAEVRHSQRHGDRHAIGAQRLHTLPKLDLPENTGRIEKVQILINDYQSRTRKEPAIATPAAVPEAIEPGSQVEDDTRADVFEPKPIPRAAKPALPKLDGSPSGSIRFTPDQAS